ncbi:MAG: phosphotransferase [Clostridia bacterium]|nr:phosphotransferase [Clostridia bacterium]
MDRESLLEALSNKLKKQVLSAAYREEKLQGGTLGDVRLISGTAELKDDGEEPFKLVYKAQKRWIRPGDPGSWRREYDLYSSSFCELFADELSMPACYLARVDEGENRIWMEHLPGVSGGELSAAMLETAAYRLGSFQGRLFNELAALRAVACLSDEGYMSRECEQWHGGGFGIDFLCSDKCRISERIKAWIRRNPWSDGKTLEYHYLRSNEYAVADRFKRMLIYADDRRGDILRAIASLPVVLCHRDFWSENIFYNEGRIALIDWDCAGFGYLGEDIASLIIDETEPENYEEYFRRFIAAYNAGISERAEIAPVSGSVIVRMMTLKFGYRIMQEEMFADSDEGRYESARKLEALYALWASVERPPF